MITEIISILIEIIHNNGDTAKLYKFHLHAEHAQNPTFGSMQHRLKNLTCFHMCGIFVVFLKIICCVFAVSVS